MFRNSFIAALAFAIAMFGQQQAQRQPAVAQPGAGDTAQAQMKLKLFKAHCFCQISTDVGARPGSLNSIADLGILKEYSGFNPDNQANQGDCLRLCSTQAFQWWQDPSNRDQACAKNGPGTMTVKAYAHVGAQPWENCQTLATSFRCCGQAGNISCPSGWLADWNGPGNDKCKRQTCSNLNPPPPNNTQIGNWGFTWGNGIWQWGPASNIVWPVVKACQ